MAVLVLLAAVVAGYFALGMPGMDHSGGGMSGMSGMQADMALGVDEFANRADASGTLLVNVHTPDEGSIPGTDAKIPYDKIADDPTLPADRATPILLYCKTGRMSKVAADTLMAKGYRNVRFLDGGMDAWVASGRPLR